MTRRNKKSAEGQKKPRRTEGMRIKMFGYFALFTIIVLVVIWLFQIVLLGSIYRMTKSVQAKSATEKIAAEADSGDIEEYVYKTASEYNVCVSVYKITDGMGQEIVRAHTQNICVIHTSYMADAFLGSVYKGAEDADGKVYTYSEDNEHGGDGDMTSLVCARLTDASDGSKLLTVVNSEIQPVSATVTTLRYQLILITVILLVVSAVMAYIISKKVTRPVAAMNEEAKKLALGDYEVNFEGGEFTETAQLGKTLNYAAEELSKLDNMQKELIANISHDLRTPLTMISGYSEVMRDIPGENTPENVQIIIDETARLTSLVNDMLDLSRISGGKRELRASVFSLTDCIGKTTERYKRLCARGGYTISFVPCGEVFVEADEVLILQVVYNLVNNAINYTGDDKKVTITQTLSADGKSCRISVTDTGDGIPEEKLPLIWDRYYKASDYHRRGVVGTGLGLSIVKNALVLHGAQFGVSSEVGRGSTFWFELPVTDMRPKNNE